MKKYFTNILPAIILLFTTTYLSGENLYDDNFDIGFSGWTTSGQVNSSKSLNKPFRGADGVTLRSTGNIQRKIPTTGFQNIIVSFHMGGDSLDNNAETGEVLWYNGSQWNLLTVLKNGDPEENNQLHYYRFHLPSGANNRANFSLQFRLNGSGTGDYLMIDDVAVTYSHGYPEAPSGKILRQWWNISGYTIEDLTGTEAFPSNPAGSTLLNNFEAPVNWGDSHGQRIAGYLYPQKSGQYTFWIAADNRGELWLSSDANPANKKLIAWTYAPTSSRQWEKYPTQKSLPIILQAGSVYYIEALGKEGGGGDNLAAAWSPPGGGRALIPGSVLAPFDPADEPDRSYIWIEAEDGAAGYPMVVKSDSKNDQTPNQEASQEIYLGVAGWSSAGSTAPEDGHVVFDINGLNGTRSIWARVNGPWSGSTKFWTRIDNEAWKKWDAGVSGSWQWRKVFQGDLSKKKTFTLAYCENRGMLDKILITSNNSFVPGGLGGSGEKEYTPNEYRSSAVDTYGKLQVKGSRLCDESGNPVQLRGIATHGLQWFPPEKDRTIADLAETFPFNPQNKTGLSIVRLAMYVEDFWTADDFWNGYLAAPEKRKAFEMDLIDDAISAGVYVVVDWHIHQNPVTDKYNSSGGLEKMAQAFFSEMAARYKNIPNILWEICNEPVNASWNSDIKPYALRMIPLIREHSENIIIVGTPSWSQDVDAAANNPITGHSNILYALHFYAASHDHIMPKVSSALSKGLPLIATEWGTTDYAASYTNFQKADRWFDEYINPNYISWINWSFAPKDEASSLIKPGVSLAGFWSDEELTESGKWIQDKMMTIVPKP